MIALTRGKRMSGNCLNDTLPNGVRCGSRAGKCRLGHCCSEVATDPSYRRREAVMLAVQLHGCAVCFSSGGNGFFVAPKKHTEVAAGYPATASVFFHASASLLTWRR